MICPNRFRVFLLLFFAANILFAQPKAPQEPTSPKIPGEQRLEERNVRGEVTEANVIRTITLCDGRTLRGQTKEQNDGFSFLHTKDGIEYKKQLKWSEVQMIKIDSWELKQKKEEKKGITYEALPKKIRIRTKQGEFFYKESGLADLKLLSLSIENQNGVATVYSYWVDLLYPNQTWYSGLPNPKGDKLVREDCYKDVVRMIEWE